MGVKSYTIGEVSRLSGQSVRRIRFYSDKGLLPPSLRSESNYRIYTDTDLAKLDLIRALREAGVGLAAIGKLLQRRLSLRDVLRARLDILEVEIATKHRSAALIRAVLHIPNPADGDLRRIWTMSNLSNQQMKSLVEGFVSSIATGTSLEGKWRQQVLDMSVAEMPDDPTPEQLAAWEELATLLADPAFVREVQKGAKTFWTDALDPTAYHAASQKAYNSAAQAVNEGLSPESAEAQAIAREWFDCSAQALGRTADRDFLNWHLAQFEKNAGRLGRYRELLAILHGSSSPFAADRQTWGWLNDTLNLMPMPSRNS